MSWSPQEMKILVPVTRYDPSACGSALVDTWRAGRQKEGRRGEERRGHERTHARSRCTDTRSHTHTRGHTDTHTHKHAQTHTRTHTCPHTVKARRGMRGSVATLTAAGDGPPPRTSAELRSTLPGHASKGRTQSHVPLHPASRA
jgi:hypothetical protein